MSFLNVGRYSDDYTSAYYYPDLSSSIKNATLAITAVENQLEAATTTAHEKEFFPNVKQFARIGVPILSVSLSIISDLILLKVS
ncbi:hypothetical protein NXW48_18055 [Phocaeicola vulgatus]|nr:hypothetical protein [Phocaeicola vulgatus]